MTGDWYHVTTSTRGAWYKPKSHFFKTRIGNTLISICGIHVPVEISKQGDQKNNRCSRCNEILRREKRGGKRLWK